MAICFCGHPVFPFLLSSLHIFFPFSVACTSNCKRYSTGTVFHLHVQHLPKWLQDYDRGPCISQHLCSDTNELENLWIFFLVLLHQFTSPGSSCSSLYIFPGSGPCCPEWHRAQQWNTTSSCAKVLDVTAGLPSTEPICWCKHQAVLLQNRSMGQKSLSFFNIHAIPERMELELLSTITIQTTTIIFYNPPFLLVHAVWPTKGYACKIVRLQLLSC